MLAASVDGFSLSQNDVVVMDFAKVFDKVAHNRLLYKLSQRNVRSYISPKRRNLFSTKSQRRRQNKPQTGRSTRDDTEESGKMGNWKVP